MRLAILAVLLVTLVGAAPAEDLPGLQEVLDQGFEVSPMEGGSMPLAELVGSGRPVVVEFWATWCVPCRKTFPDLEELEEKYGERVVVVGLTVEDPETDRAKVRRFAEEHDVSFPIAFAPDELFRFMNRRKGISVPKLFVFDATGALVRYFPRHSFFTSFKLKSAVARAIRRQGAS